MLVIDSYVSHNVNSIHVILIPSPLEGVVSPLTADVSPTLGLVFC